MEQLRERLASTGRALDTLDESLGMPFPPVAGGPGRMHAREKYKKYPTSRFRRRIGWPVR